jgi:hypothetical protein
LRGDSPFEDVAESGMEGSCWSKVLVYNDQTPPRISMAELIGDGFE